MEARRVRRLAWLLWAVAIVLAGAAVVYLILGRSDPTPAGQFGFRGFSVVFALTFGTVGALIASRHPRNPIGWIFLMMGVGAGLQELANQYAIYGLSQNPRLPGALVAAWFPAWIWIPSTSGAMFLLLLFPDGHLPSPRWRWALRAGVLGVVMSSIGFALLPGPLENFRTVDNPFGAGSLGTMTAIGILGQLLYGISIMAAALALVLRFRRSRGEEREQLKWLASAGVLLAVTLLSSLIGNVFIGTTGTTAAVPFPVALTVILGFVSVPLATGIAILKYRLYDIDVVINKAVVFGLLAAFITVVYVGIVAGVGATVGVANQPVLSAAAAAVIALAFQPVRGWARRVANQLVYGERATPYEVLAEFSGRLADTYSADDVMPRMAQIVAAGTGAEQATVWLRFGNELRAEAASDDHGPAAAVLLIDGDLPSEAGGHTWAPVRHRGELLGAISVVMPQNEPITSAQERLVTDVASQAGLVLSNVRLIEDLRASRQRLVAAQDEERRKIERNLHDGVQQQLIAMNVQLGLLARVADADPSKAREMASALQTLATETLEDLRDLARGIYPPLLADKGLAAALEAQARKAAVPTAVGSDAIGRYSQDVEAAVYFCVLEALNNVAKYSNATSAAIELSDQVGHLRFRVSDDAVGFDVTANAQGTGLQGMADRLDAIGGALTVESEPGHGTTVAGRVPVGATS